MIITGMTEAVITEVILLSDITISMPNFNYEIKFL